MDLLRTILVSIVVALVVVLAVYALFALFQAVGFLWALVIVFVISLIVVGSMPDNAVTRVVNINTDRFF